VEGESDTWTLALHGLPVLGIPGATQTKKLESDHLDSCNAVFAVQEPDSGGKTFVAGLQRRLNRMGWSGEFRVITMETLGAKDPNAMYLSEPDSFLERFQQAMKQASLLDIPADSKHHAASGGTSHDPSCTYTASAKGMVYMKERGDGVDPVRLTNFTARIAADIRRDDGEASQRVFRLEAELHRRTHTIEVPARQFESLGWILEQLGAEAVVYPGRSLRDHLRAAIQVLSRDIRSHTVYAHSGWRRVEGRWLYLHGGGAIDSTGLVPEIQVDLPSSARQFVLPQPPSGNALKDAVRASLDMLEAAPDAVIFPVYAAVWRSVLGPADFGVHLTGGTGAGKTELAALAQQHFGAGLDARNLPGSWSSTGNALEALAFVFKDALLVVDDFAPFGNASDVARAHRIFTSHYGFFKFFCHVEVQGDLYFLPD